MNNAWDAVEHKAQRDYWIEKQKKTEAALRLVIARNNDKPWEEISSQDVQSWVDEARRLGVTVKYYGF